MKYSLAVFDMDGTILNTLDDLVDSCNHVLQCHNMPVHTTDEIKYMVGNGVPKLIERAVPEGKNNSEYEAVLADFVEYYEKHAAQKTRPYDGMLEMLKTLKSAGVKLAVNTNKIEPAALILCDRYFPGLFDFVSGGRSDHAPKPASDGLKNIYLQAGITYEQAQKEGGAVFIGDSDVDIQTGKNAGISAIGVSWGFRGKTFLLEHGANVVVDNCKELLEKLIK